MIIILFLYSDVFSLVFFSFTTNAHPVSAVLFRTYGFYLRKSFIMRPGHYCPKYTTVTTATIANHNNIIPLPPSCTVSPRAPSFRLLLLLLCFLVFPPLPDHSSLLPPPPAVTDRIINITIIITQIYRVVIIIMTPPRRIPTNNNTTRISHKLRLRLRRRRS